MPLLFDHHHYRQDVWRNHGRYPITHTKPLGKPSKSSTVRSREGEWNAAGQTGDAQMVIWVAVALVCTLFSAGWLLLHEPYATRVGGGMRDLGSPPSGAG